MFFHLFDYGTYICGGDTCIKDVIYLTPTILLRYQKINMIMYGKETLSYNKRMFEFQKLYHLNCGDFLPLLLTLIYVDLEDLL